MTTTRKAVPTSIRQAVIARDGYVCQYCNSSTAAAYEIEHVIPLSQGGTSEVHNLVIACEDCNGLKHWQVWTPQCLETSGRDHPEWRAQVLAHNHGPNFIRMVRFACDLDYAGERRPFNKTLLDIMKGI